MDVIPLLSFLKFLAQNFNWIRIYNQWWWKIQLQRSDGSPLGNCRRTSTRTMPCSSLTYKRHTYDYNLTTSIPDFEIFWRPWIGAISRFCPSLTVCVRVRVGALVRSSFVWRGKKTLMMIFGWTLGMKWTCYERPFFKFLYQTIQDRCKAKTVYPNNLK